MILRADLSKLFSCFLFLYFISFPLFSEEKNRIIACDNSLEMYEWCLDFVREAQHSIEIGACIAGGNIYRELLKEFEARIKVCPSIQIHILVSPIFLDDDDLVEMNRLKKKFPQNVHIEIHSCVLKILPNVGGIDNHIKMLIVDETYFSFGGTNYAETLRTDGTSTVSLDAGTASGIDFFFPTGVRDQDIVGKGPLARELRKVFFQLFSQWEIYNRIKKFHKKPDSLEHVSAYFPLNGLEKPSVDRFESSEEIVELEKNQIKLVLGGPHQKKNKIAQEYIRLLNSAQNEILIANPYLYPQKRVFKAFLDAINRGVKVKIITNGPGKTAPQHTKTFCWANRVNYVPFLYGKKFKIWDVWSSAKQPVKDTQIFEYHVTDIMIHKKIMIIDNETFVIGSYNLGAKSDKLDYEMIAVCSSHDIVEKARKIFEKDLSFSKEITVKRARKWYFNPLISYLGELQKRVHNFF